MLAISTLVIDSRLLGAPDAPAPPGAPPAPGAPFVPRGRLEDLKKRGGIYFNDFHSL